jgi:cell division protein FtsQ
VTGFFLFLGIVMVLESPLTRVRQIVVTGNATVPQTDIVKASQLEKGISLWQVNGGHVQDLVRAAQPRVDSVDVRVDYLTGTVTLAVREKPVVAVLEAGGRFYQLLSDGKVYAAADGRSGFSWPLLTADGVDSVAVGNVPTPVVATVCSQLARISRDNLNEISEIHLNKYGVATLYLINHFAADCRPEAIGASLGEIDRAVEYFRAKGYAPGLIDMTGGPPYRYTPFPSSPERRS